MSLNTQSASRIDWDTLHLEVARKRLQASTDQTDALEAVREIVSNLIGSEEIAIFKLEPDREVLTLFWSFGIDVARDSTLDVAFHPQLKRVIAGEPYLADRAHRGEEFAALIPLRLRAETVAVLAIQRLLPQKPCFSESDVQLVHVLSGEAGRALFGERAISA